MTTSLDRMTDFFLRMRHRRHHDPGPARRGAQARPRESIAIAKRIIRRASVPIIVGVSAPGFAAMRSLAREVMELGAAGVMIGPPNTLRTDDQIVDVLPPGGRGDRLRRAVRAPGLPADVLGRDDARP